MDAITLDRFIGDEACVLHNKFFEALKYDRKIMWLYIIISKIIISLYKSLHFKGDASKYKIKAA